MATPSSTSPVPPSPARERRLQLERLGERLEREEGEQAGGQGHERGEPLRRRARRSDGSQASPSATGTMPTRRPMSP